jgi:hypothetical protein
MAPADAALAAQAATAAALLPASAPAVISAAEPAFVPDAAHAQPPTNTREPTVASHVPCERAITVGRKVLLNASVSSQTDAVLASVAKEVERLNRLRIEGTDESLTEAATRFGALVAALRPHRTKNPFEWGALLFNSARLCMTSWNALVDPSRVSPADEVEARAAELYSCGAPRHCRGYAPTLLDAALAQFREAGASYERASQLGLDAFRQREDCLRGESQCQGIMRQAQMELERSLEALDSSIATPAQETAVFEKESSVLPGTCVVRLGTRRFLLTGPFARVTPDCGADLEGSDVLADCPGCASDCSEAGYAFVSCALQSAALPAPTSSPGTNLRADRLCMWCLRCTRDILGPATAGKTQPTRSSVDLGRLSPAHAVHGVLATALARAARIAAATEAEAFDARR